MWAASSLFELIAVGDLSDLGPALLLLAAGLILGPAAGVTVALLVARQKRAVATGLMSVPLMLAAIAVSFSLLDNIDQGSDNIVPGLIAVAVAVVSMVAAIWLARHLTARRR